MSRTIFRWTCGASAVCLVASLVSAQKKPPESPLLRVQSEMVLVDLVATDQEGNPVQDLRPEELQVFEDGKKQKLQFFDYLAGGEDSPAEESDAYSAAAPTDEASLILFLDMASLEADVFLRVKESLSEFLTQPGSSDTRIMLASYRNGLSIHHGLHEDRAMLAEALSRIEPVPESESALSSFRRFYEKMETIFRDSAGDAISIAASEGKAFASGIELQAEAVSKSLNVLIRSVRAVPGRKQLLFLSSGYPLRPMNIVRQVIDKRTRGSGSQILSSAHKERMNAILSANTGGDPRAHLRDVIDQANRCQVSFYSIDARGLMAASVTGQARDWGSVSRLGSDFIAEIRDAVQRAPQAFLTELASGTGGRAFLNSNNLMPGIQAALGDARSYYLLAYRPKNKRKLGKFHKIEVKLNRPGVTARYRKGYLETDPQDVTSGDIMAALNVPALFADYPFQVQVDQQPGKITFNTIVPTRSLRFSREGDRLHCAVEVYGILIDSKGKWVGKDIYFTRGHQFESITAQQKEKVLSYATFSLTAEAKPPTPGEYRMVVVLRQGSDGTLCAHQQTVRVGG